MNEFLACLKIVCDRISPDHVTAGASVCMCVFTFAALIVGYKKFVKENSIRIIPEFIAYEEQERFGSYQVVLQNFSRSDDIVFNVQFRLRQVIGPRFLLLRQTIIPASHKGKKGWINIHKMTKSLPGCHYFKSNYKVDLLDIEHGTEFIVQTRCRDSWFSGHSQYMTMSYGVLGFTEILNKKQKKRLGIKK